jgi:hypothetical protein
MECFTSSAVVTGEVCCMIRHAPYKTTYLVVLGCVLRSWVAGIKSITSVPNGHTGQVLPSLLQYARTRKT